MRLDGTRLRSRRLQLGLTMRGLARETGISQTLVKRLEDTGEVDSITCATLQRLVNALSVDLIDILEKGEAPPCGNDELLERLGAILLGRRSGITTTALASSLAIDASIVEKQLVALAAQLHPLGICVHRGSAGTRLVPSSRESLSPPQHLDAPTSTDLRLLHRAIRGELHARDIAAMKHGNISLNRLMNAGLVDIRPSGNVIASQDAFDALEGA